MASTIASQVWRSVAAFPWELRMATFLSTESRGDTASGLFAGPTGTAIRTLAERVGPLPHFTLGMIVLQRLYKGFQEEPGNTLTYWQRVVSSGVIFPIIEALPGIGYLFGADAMRLQKLTVVAGGLYAATAAIFKSISQPNSPEVPEWEDLKMETSRTQALPPIGTQGPRLEAFEDPILSYKKDLPDQDLNESMVEHDKEVAIQYAVHEISEELNAINGRIDSFNKELVAANIRVQEYNAASERHAQIVEQQHQAVDHYHEKVRHYGEFLGYKDMVSRIYEVALGSLFVAEYLPWGAVALERLRVARVALVFGRMMAGWLISQGRTPTSSQ